MKLPKRPLAKIVPSIQVLPLWDRRILPSCFKKSREPIALSAMEIHRWCTIPNMFSTRIFCREVLPIRSEEHTSELQSRPHLVCRLLLEKKKKKTIKYYIK